LCYSLCNEDTAANQDLKLSDITKLSTQLDGPISQYRTTPITQFSRQFGSPAQDEYQPTDSVQLRLT